MIIGTTRLLPLKCLFDPALFSRRKLLCVFFVVHFPFVITFKSKFVPARKYCMGWLVSSPAFGRLHMNSFSFFLRILLSYDSDKLFTLSAINNILEHVLVVKNHGEYKVLSVIDWLLWSYFCLFQPFAIDARPWPRPTLMHLQLVSKCALAQVYISTHSNSRLIAH